MLEEETRLHLAQTGHYIESEKYEKMYLEYIIDKSKTHREIASKYGVLRRRLHRLLNNESLSDEDINSELKKIEEEWDALSSIAPTTSIESRNKAHEIIKKEQK